MPELGWTDYPLPSRGVLYEDKIPGGVVSLREMAAKQVALLQTQGGGITGKLDAIVDACCKLPDPSFKKRDLLLVDRFAIFLALRTKSFGHEYDFKWRCRSCGHWGSAHVNIGQDLNEKVGGKDTVEPVEVTLPGAGCTVQCRFLRGHDEDTVVRNAKRMKLESNDDQDPSYLIRLALQLVARDGEEFSNILERQRFIEQLTATDLYQLEDTVSAAEPGIDTRLLLTCNACDSDSEVQMPFTAEFFRPRQRGGPRNA